MYIINHGLSFFSKLSSRDRASRIFMIILQQRFIQTTVNPNKCRRSEILLINEHPLHFLFQFNQETEVCVYYNLSISKVVLDNCNKPAYAICQGGQLLQLTTFFSLPLSCLDSLLQIGPNSSRQPFSLINLCSS